MFNIFLLLGFLSLEVSADFQSDSEVLLRHNHKRSLDDINSRSNSPFIDLTAAINQQNLLEIEKSLNFTSKVHYSTSQHISEISNLSWVSNMLSDIYENDQPESNASLCLSFSFQITKNRSDIDWRYINDILNRRTKNSEENAEYQENLKVLGQYLCQVILDFQIDEPDNIEYQRSQAYAKKWDISFTKYAKLILETIFGANKNFSVGVMYTEAQVIMQDMVLLEQEISHADFAIVNLQHFPLIRAPLDGMILRHHLFEFRYRNRDFIRSSMQNFTWHSEIPFKFMLTWTDYKPSSKLNCPACLAEDQVYLESRSLYGELFFQYVEFEIRFGHGEIGIISGIRFNNEKRRWLDYDLRHSNYHHTYLHVQESETKVCQLGKMLAKISYEFSNVAISEYTWSAIAQFYDKISNAEHMAKQCGNETNRRVRLPKNFMLLASPGIGRYWNQTGSAFKNLMQRNRQIGNLSIATIVFSADDLNSGTSSFVKSQTEANATKIGCLVDITSVVSHATASPPAIIELMKQKCNSILSESALLIWQIQVDKQTTTNQEFTYDFDSSLKLNLIKMLIARELYKSTNPNQEVMFRVSKSEETSDVFMYKGIGTQCLSYADHIDSKFLDRVLLKWGALHKVNIMTVMPAFDLKNSLMGMFPIPDETAEQSSRTQSRLC